MMNQIAWAFAGISMGVLYTTMLWRGVHSKVALPTAIIRMTAVAVFLFVSVKFGFILAATIGWSLGVCLSAPALVGWSIPSRRIR